MSDAKKVSTANAFSLPLEPLNQRVREKLHHADMSLKCLQAAQLMWDKLLTVDEQHRLGGDLVAAYEKYHGPVRIYLQVRKVWFIRAIIEVARGVDLLSETDYRWLDREISKVDPLLSVSRRAARRPITSERDPEDIIAQECPLHKLLLVQGKGAHCLYWKDEQVLGPWSKNLKIWELLWELARHAKTGQAVAWDQLSTCNTDAIVDRRARLKKFIPGELNLLIKPTGDAGNYRLTLDPTHIYLLTIRPDQLPPVSD